MTLTLKDGGLILNGAFPMLRRIIITNPLKSTSNNYTNAFSGLWLTDIIADITFHSAIPDIKLNPLHLVHPNPEETYKIATTNNYHYIHPSVDYPEPNIQLKTKVNPHAARYRFSSNMTVKIIAFDRTTPTTNPRTSIHAAGDNIEISTGIYPNHMYEHFIYFDTHEVDVPFFKFGTPNPDHTNLEGVEKVLVNDLGSMETMYTFIGNSSNNTHLTLVKFKDMYVSEHIGHWSWAFDNTKSIIAILNIHVAANEPSEMLNNLSNIKCITGILNFNEANGRKKVADVGALPHLVEPTKAKFEAAINLQPSWEIHR